MPPATFIKCRDQNVVKSEDDISVIVDDVKPMIHVQCRQCFRAFDSTDFAPATISCGHTFCKTCINAPFIRGLFVCFFCHKEVTIGFKNADKNRQMLNLLNKAKLLNPESSTTITTSSPDNITKLTDVTLDVNKQLYGVMESHLKEPTVSTDKNIQVAFLAVYEAIEALEIYLTFSKRQEVRLLKEPPKKTVVQFKKSDSDFFEVTSCIVCFNLYNKSSRVPYSMACGHTFCSSCVSSIGASSRKFYCPTCRKITDIPKHGMEPNMLLLSILKPLKLLANDNRDNGVCPKSRRVAWTDKTFRQVLTQMAPSVMRHNNQWLLGQRPPAGMQYMQWMFIQRSVHDVIDALYQVTTDARKLDLKQLNSH